MNSFPNFYFSLILTFISIGFILRRMKFDSLQKKRELSNGQFLSKMPSSEKPGIGAVVGLNSYAVHLAHLLPGVVAEMDYRRIKAFRQMDFLVHSKNLRTMANIAKRLTGYKQTYFPGHIRPCIIGFGDFSNSPNSPIRGNVSFLCSFFKDAC